MSHQQHNNNPEENGASQEEPTHQSNTNGRRHQPMSADRAPTAPTLSQRYADAPENIQAMADRTDEQGFAIASRIYLAKHTAHGLEKLHVEVNEVHADAKIANEWTEARVAGTNVHSDVAQFNMASENIFQGQLLSLLEGTGDQCVKYAQGSPWPKTQPKPERQGLGGLFGWFVSRQKVIIERVPTDRPGSIVPDEVLFDD